LPTKRAHEAVVTHVSKLCLVMSGQAVQMERELPTMVMLGRRTRHFNCGRARAPWQSQSRSGSGSQLAGDGAACTDCGGEGLPCGWADA
jgi:hypothetical protein